MENERRETNRPESLNLLDYVVVDEQGRLGEYGMGRTLNVSKGGILMEAHLALLKGQRVMITLELKNSLVNITGKIVYVAYENKMYRYGIEFSHLSDDDQRLLNAYVNIFHEYKLHQDAEQEAVRRREAVGK